MLSHQGTSATGVKQTHGFENMAAWRQYGFDMTGEHAELPEVTLAAGGSSSLLSVLGVHPVLGRWFTPCRKKIQPEANHVAMLDPRSLFQRRFAGDRSVIGKQVHLDATPYTIIGVLPASFTYPDSKIQLWVPYAQTFTPKVYAMHDTHMSHVVARLRPGIRAAAATKEVSALQYQIHLANPVEAGCRRRNLPSLD